MYNGNYNNVYNGNYNVYNGNYNVYNRIKPAALPAVLPTPQPASPSPLTPTHSPRVPTRSPRIPTRSLFGITELLKYATLKYAESSGNT